MKEHVDLIRGSGFFDESWYLNEYPDVRMLEMDPILHYLEIGALLERKTGKAFDGNWYLERYSDVKVSGEAPLLHYLVFGRQEGREMRAVGQQPARKMPVLAGASSPRSLAMPNVNYHAGHLKRIDGAKTILVCAHVSGKYLFGSERSLLDILDGFVACGYNVVVAMPGIANRDYLKALRERCYRVASFRYGWWRKGVGVDQAAVAAFARVLSESSVDAVHANTIMLREPLIAARRTGIPAVVHVRELIEADAALCDLIGETSADVVARVTESADWVVANSQATARSFSKSGHAFVIPNTTDIDPDAIELPAPGSGVVRIGLISSNIPKKGLQDFVEVANLLASRSPNARFVLVGPDNEHTAKLKRDQEEGAISPRLVFAGYRDSPAEAIREIDVLVNLSHFQESFGRTVLEAMVAGRPVVAYDWGALNELVVDGVTGYMVPFRDIAAVADAIELLCKDPESITRMGAAGKQRAVAEFSKSKYAQLLQEAYARILDPADPLPLERMVLPARADSPIVASPMRIAYFLWHFPVPSETFVLNELRILVERGHDVRVFCKQSPHKDFKPDFAIEWERVKDPAELAQRLQETGRTIVHSHFAYPTVTDMVWPACELAKIRFTFIAHAQDIFRHANDERNRIGEIGSSPWCLRVLVPSRFHRNYLLDRGVPEGKLFINPNGIDPDLYKQGLDCDHAERRSRSICAIHRFTAKKGLESLIEAGAELAEDGISIHLYGYGELETSYRETIARLGLKNVHIHGAVKSRQDMLSVFLEHDLFACPSIRAQDGDMDGIPTVLMEAMASGLPVLTTSISGIPDLVQDGITGILCEADPASIANAVRRFYAMPHVAVEAMIEDAAVLIDRRFNSQKLTAALLWLWEGRTIDLMIVSWNNPAQLREVVSRLEAFTSMPFHLIICDNGSDGEVTAYLSEAYAAYDNLTVILNRDNAFVGPGTNICMEHGRSEYAVYVCGKEGFVFDHGWEKDLLAYMDASPEVGLGGTLCYSPSYLTGSKYPNAIPLFPSFRNQSFALENPDRRFGHIQGGFFVLRRAMYDQIGGFSEAVPHSYTDVEYSYYAESLGWKLGTPPGLLALFNKTRPGIFSRVDEAVVAMHPPLLEDLPLLDRIARREVVHCNVCGWAGEAFMLESGAPLCGDCGSSPTDRSLYRFLAESSLTYRRLSALGVNIGAPLQQIWRQQFQGDILTDEEFMGKLQSGERLRFRNGSLSLVCLLIHDERHLDTAIDEVGRVLADDGMLLLRLPDAVTRADRNRALEGVKRSLGLLSIDKARYSSQVVGFDTAALYIGRRLEVDACVS